MANPNFRQSFRGNPRRDVNRRINYLVDKAFTSGDEDAWSRVNQLERNAQNLSVNPRRFNRNAQCAVMWRDGKTKPKAQRQQPQQAQGQTQLRNSGLKTREKTPPVDTPMYSVGLINSMIPMTQEYGQNLDFSTFPLVVDTTYRDMESVGPSLAKICHTTHDMELPVPVVEYISHATSTHTQQGDSVRFNVPALAVPIGSADESCRTYGRVTAQNHVGVTTFAIGREDD